MSNKLYVGNLPFSATEESLKSVFSEAGNVVSATIIIDRDTNRSKGFGFVEMGTADEAAKAIELMNGKELEGRALKVNVAKPKETTTRRKSW